ncbi:cyclomaltodextrin glucanotransferase [Oxalobacteraceae bacterium GrIS 2.11]
MKSLHKLLIHFTALLFALFACLNPAHAEPTAADQAEDFRFKTIYFLLPDRFNLYGTAYVDPQYPDASNPVNCFQAACETEQEFRSYWGGNVQGVIQKLDYLHKVGISAVWLGPMMQNVPGYDPEGWGTGYHGYWVDNVYNVNPYFGQWSDIDQLSSALHQHGMRYIQDITLNHSNPSDSHVHGLLYGVNNTQVVASYQDDDSQFYKHFEGDSRCIEAQQIPDSQWDYWQLHHCLLAKLSGYNQDNPATANYLNEGYKVWLTHGVDGLREDAVKFVFPDFVARFNHMVDDYARSRGRPAPYIVGEWSNGGVSDLKSLAYANSYSRFLSNILDFQLSFALNRYVGGSYEPTSQYITAAQLGEFLDQRVAAFHGRDTWQGSFIDNHDQVRTLVRLQKLNVQDEAERKRRMDLATVLLMTVRGVPIIYYGDEQYLAHYNDHATIPPDDINSSNDDPYNRVGMKTWNQNTSAFRIIRTLAQLRKTSPAIALGDYRTLYADDNILVFLRSHQNDRVLVAVNRGISKTITLPEPMPVANGQYSNLLQNSGTNEINRCTVSDQHVELELDAQSAMVLRF